MFISYAFHKDGIRFSVLENSFEVKSYKEENYLKVFRQQMDISLLKQLADIADRVDYVLREEVYSNRDMFIAKFCLFGVVIEKAHQFSMEDNVDFKFSEYAIGCKNLNLVIGTKNALFNAFVKYLKAGDLVI